MNTTTTLPQIDYVSDGATVEPSTTVVFDTVTGAGINLMAAYLGGARELRNKNACAFAPQLGVKAKIAVKIHVLGCSAYKRQVMSLRSTRRGESISRERLAHTIAREMQRYMATNLIMMNNHVLTLDNLVLVALHRVSRGSWQPEFQVVF